MGGLAVRTTCSRRSELVGFPGAARAVITIIPRGRTLMYATLMSLTTSIAASVPQIGPTFNAPWMPTLNSVTSMVIGTALVAIMIAGVIGGVLFLFGKLTSSSRAQDVGLSIFLWVAVVGALIAGVSALVRWGAGLPLFG